MSLLSPSTTLRLARHRPGLKQPLQWAWPHPHPRRLLSRSRPRSDKPQTSPRASEAAPQKHPPPQDAPTPPPGSRISIPGPSWLWTSVEPLAAPLRAYSRAQARRPYAVQITSSIVIYCLGDLVAQYMKKAPADGRSASTPDGGATAPAKTHDDDDVDDARSLWARYSPQRTLRAITIGAIFSLPSYHWFLWLSYNFNVAPHVPYARALSLLAKICINQAVFTPVFNTYFFGMQSLLSTVPVYADARDEAGAAERKGSRDEAAAQLDETGAAQRKSWREALRDAGEHVRRTVPTSWYNSCKFWPLVTAFSFTFVPPQSRSAFAGVVAIGWQAYLGLLNRREDERRRRAAAAAAAAAA